MNRFKIPIISIICLVGLILIEPTEYLMMIMLSVACHEAGHLTVMKLLGIDIESVTVLPVGIDIKRRERIISYPEEIFLAISGAMVNILLFFIFNRYGFFAYSNLLYAIINLIPIKGLDGGAALEAFLLCFFDPGRTERILKTVSVVFCVLLWMLGVYIVFMLDGNISIFALSVFLFASVILKKADVP